MILLPLSRSNIVAMAIILFLWSWNQYLWPLLVTTDKSMATAVIGLRQLMPAADAAPAWHVLMSATLHDNGAAGALSCSWLSDGS